MRKTALISMGFSALLVVVLSGCTQHKERVVALEEENADLRQDRQELDYRLAVATEKTQATRTRVSELQAQLERQIRELAELSAQNIATQEELAEAQQRLAATQAELEQLEPYRARAKNAQQQLAQLQQENETLRQKLAAAQDTAMTRVSELEAEIERLHERLREISQARSEEASTAEPAEAD